MDIVIGSGNSRQVVTFASGLPMRKMERDNPLEYVKARGNLVQLMRNGGKANES